MKDKKIQVAAVALFAAIPSSALANVDIEQLFQAHAKGDRDAAVQAIMACCSKEQSVVAAGVTERIYKESRADLNRFALILSGEEPMSTTLTDYEARALADAGISVRGTWEGNGGRTWEGNGGRTWEGSSY